MVLSLFPSCPIAILEQPLPLLLLRARWHRPRAAPLGYIWRVRKAAFGMDIDGPDASLYRTYKASQLLSPSCFTVFPSSNNVYRTVTSVPRGAGWTSFRHNSNSSMDEISGRSLWAELNWDRAESTSFFRSFNVDTRGAVRWIAVRWVLMASCIALGAP